MNKIYFCFPYRGIGGVPLLFVRIAEYLQESKLAECFLVDYRDGCMSNVKKPSLCKLMEYNDSGDKVVIPRDALVVLQSMSPWSIFPGIKFDPECRFFFWNCHPFNLVPTLPGARKLMQSNPGLGKFILKTMLFFYRRKVIVFLNLLLRKNALVFMDKTNLFNTEKYLDVKIPSPDFLPIPAGIDTIDESVVSPEFKTPLRLVWVGRIVDFKYYPLVKVISDLKKVVRSSGISITLTIVGKGQLLDNLKEKVSDISEFEIKFIHSIPPNNLDEFLINNTDILFAMGTSALEGGKLGIPTLVLDMSYQKIKSNYAYRWLNEVQGYNLAEVYDGKKKDVSLALDKLGLQHKISEVINNKRNISNKELQYFLENHKLDVVAHMLLSYLKKTKCRYKDLHNSGLSGEGIVYRAFKFLRGRG